MPKLGYKDRGVSVLAQVIAIICVIALIGAGIYIITRPAKRPEVREARSLSISAQSPVTAGQSSAITVQAHDAQGNPVSGASISLVALAMDGEYAGDYKVELTLTDMGDGTYTSSLTSTWDGTWSLVASTDDVTASGEITFVTGPPADIIASFTPAKPASSSYESTVTFYFTDAYGNSLAPDNVRPGISVPAGWSWENLRSNPNGSFNFNLVTNNWGTATFMIIENFTEISENFSVDFPPIYTEIEQDLDPVSLELVPPENENGEIQATWKDNNISMKIGIFFPAMSELGSYEMTLEYDCSALHLLHVRDWDPANGFPAPELIILSDNSFKLIQFGSAPPGGVEVAIVDFEPMRTGETDVSITDLKLYKSEYVPIYDKYGNIIGYDKIYVPVTVPTGVPQVPYVTILKPLKRLIMPLKFWIVEGFGMTEENVRKEVEKADNNCHKAAKDCKIDYWIVSIVEINRISKDNWARKVGGDNKLNPNESKTVFRQDNWNPDGWINIYVAPPCSLLIEGKSVIGWWWDQYGGSPGIFTDKSKDRHDRNLTHELMHEFSKSKVKDSPQDNAAAQGGRDPNNVMNYCGGGKEISEKQGEIINDELDKRAEQYDADGDGKPEGYIYKPKK